MKDFIKEKLENELLNENTRQNAGILIQCTTTNRFFLLKRANPPHNGKWALLSGQMDKGEDSLGAIKREIGEEISINPDIIDIQFVQKDVSPNSGTIFFFYKGYVTEEFEPKLNEENVGYIWASVKNIPQPIFPGLPQKMGQA